MDSFSASKLWSFTGRPLTKEKERGWSQEAVGGEKMATFALVHGSWHGGWCWNLLVDELEKRGHRSVAPDLPNSAAAVTKEVLDP